MPGLRLTLLIMGDEPDRLGAVVAIAGPWKAPNTLSAIIVLKSRKKGTSRGPPGRQIRPRRRAV